MEKRGLIALLCAGLAGTLSACATTTGADALLGNGECVPGPGGWCGYTHDIAGTVWPYAQMSADSYGDEDEFAPSAHYVSRWRSCDDEIGFAYEIFDRMENSALKEVVVAFRGTEDLADWWYGNILGVQNRRGLELIRIIFEQLDRAGYAGVPVTVTGHSLGGGIAHYVSLRELPTGDGGTRTVAASYVFNNSPRYWRGPARVERIAVVERGELLSLFRGPAIEATQQYLSLDCRPGFHPLSDHKIRALAECVTWIAAFTKAEAMDSLRANPGIEQPRGQPNDEQPPEAQSGVAHHQAGERDQQPGEAVRAEAGERIGAIGRVEGHPLPQQVQRGREQCDKPDPVGAQQPEG
jgi:hypothetical protein